MKNALLEILDSDRLLDEGETARVLNISVASLQRDRHVYSNNPQVPYIKIGRSVRYDPAVIKKLIELNSVGKLPETPSN